MPEWPRHPEYSRINKFIGNLYNSGNNAISMLDSDSIKWMDT